MSEKSETVWKRRPGLVGLSLRSAIMPWSVREELDRLALDEGDDRSLGVGSLAVGERPPVALALARAVQRVHLGHAHAEDLLHGVADLVLVRRRPDGERVGPVLHEGVGLLAHHRG